MALFSKDTEPRKTLPNRQIRITVSNRWGDTEGEVSCPLDEYCPLVRREKAIAQPEVPHLCHELPYEYISYSSMALEVTCTYQDGVETAQDSRGWIEKVDRARQSSRS